MKDDNQKTFADLFSSSNITREDDSSNNTEEKNVSDSITFGSLFEEHFEDKENLDKDNANNMEISSDKSEESLDSDTHTNFNAIVFDSSESDDTNLNSNGVDNSESLVENASSEDRNIFSSDSSSDNEVSSSDIEVESSDNEENSNDESSVKLNMFSFDNNNTSDSELSSSEVEDDVTGNKEENNDESNTKESGNESFENVFFGNDDDANGNVSDVTSSKVEITDSFDHDVVKNDKVSDSDSPFFQEQTDNSVGDNVDNPLFLGTLNLVENENEEKMVKSIDVSNSKHFNVKIVKKKEPLFKVIIGILSYALFIWLLLVGIVLLIYVLDIKIRASKGDYSAPKYNAYVVLTGSMLPKIQVYDVVVTKKVEASELKVGDVITFASADTRFLNTIITHRIIKKNYDPDTKSYSFQTRGDNNNVADSALVPQGNIYGKVFLKIPKLGYLQEFLASDGGWIIVILIPCLAVLSYDIVKLVKGLSRKKYKNIKVQK